MKSIALIGAMCLGPVVNGCEDDEASPPARAPVQAVVTPTPPEATAAAGDDDDPPIRKRKSAPPAPSDPAEAALAPGQGGVIVRDEKGKVVAAMPYGPEFTLEGRRAEVQRALEPLMKDAVADYEKAAARRAIDVAMAAVETRSVAEAIKTALDMYATDVDRAERLKTGKP